MKTIELNVPGILERPGKAEGWTDRAVTLAHTQAGVHAEKLESFAGVFTRMWFQERRAQGVAAMGNCYLAWGWRVVMRGHSNGCEVIRRALFLMKGTVDVVQFIAPAVEADFEANGLNPLLREGKVRRLVVCWSSEDRTLQWAKLAKPFLRLFGNGYGAMGLTGPLNVAADVARQVEGIERPNFGHSDWVSTENLAETIELTCGGLERRAARTADAAAQRRYHNTETPQRDTSTVSA